MELNLIILVFLPFYTTLTHLLTYSLTYQPSTPKQARAAWELEGSTNWQADGVDQTNGFSFEGADEGALDYALNRAIDAYYNDNAWFRGLQQRVMMQDWSWNKPGFDYIQLYFAAMK